MSKHLLDIQVYVYWMSQSRNYDIGFNVSVTINYKYVCSFAMDGCPYFSFHR